jgi:integrase
MARRAHGEGSIRKLPDGKGWEASITLPSKGDGIQRRRRAVRRTRALALDALDEIRGDRKDGIRSERLTVEQWLQGWLRRQEDSGRKDSQTLYSYRWALEQYAIPAFGHLQLRALEADHVDALLAKMRRDRASRNTMMRVRANLSMALDEAVARHKVRFNAAKLVTTPEPLKERPQAGALRPEQAADLLLAIEENRLQALWLLMLFRGLRPIEVRELRWAYVDLELGVVHVVSTKKRNGKPVGNSERDIGLGDELVNALVAHAARQAIERETYEQATGEQWPTDLVFSTAHGTPIDRANLRREAIKLFESAGIDGDWHPTDLRRSFASLAKLAGRDIAEIAADLGHRPGSRVTLASYVRDLRQVRGNDAGEAIARLLRQKR